MIKVDFGYVFSGLLPTSMADSCPGLRLANAASEGAVGFYRATLCVSAVLLSTGVCPSVCHVGVLYPDG